MKNIKFGFKKQRLRIKSKLCIYETSYVRDGVQTSRVVKH